MTLAGKTVIITGSTQGIGEALARLCAQRGANVLIHGRDEERGRCVAEAIGKAAVYHRDDLEDAHAAERIVHAAVAAFGRIDALVNNAALVARDTLESVSAAAFDRVMAINVRAPLLLIQAALDHLTSARGCVLNIGSVNGYCGEGNLLLYSVSKGALMTLSRNLGDHLHTKRQVRVNHLNVGWVLTESEKRHKIADGLPPDWHDHLPRELAPTGRILQPDEVAAMAVHWIGDETASISGSVVDLEQYPVIGRVPTIESSE